MAYQRCAVKGCLHAAMDGGRYCASHAAGHGQCPVCGLHYDTRADRLYIRSYGCCMFCQYKVDALRAYANRQAVRR